jgi:hypothetical protein
MKLRRRVGRRRHWQPKNPARACRWISGVHPRLDGPVLNELDLIIIIRWGSDHLDQCPRSRPCSWARPVIQPELSVLGLEQFGMGDRPGSFLGCA